MSNKLQHLAERVFLLEGILTEALYILAETGAPSQKEKLKELRRVSANTLEEIEREHTNV